METGAAPAAPSRPVDPVREFVLTGLAEGRLGPGEKLPTEREFAERFRRPRSAVRTALAVLEAEGLVVRTVGRGTFLAARPRLPDVAGASDASPASLMEARLLFEPHLVDLVVRNATAADLGAIATCLARSRAAKSLDDFERWDCALHLAIAQATHNDLLVRVMDLLNRARQTSRWGHLKERTLTAARREVSTAEHARILEALERRDAETARARVVEHLLGVRRNLLGD